ncbi:MAG: hypothetical protein KAU28_01545, partial [Phycisphaerae bacterium]|nr:hypothetical protein [Phycisphaerae bacterium]
LIQHQNSTDDVIGSIICQNGLAIAKLCLANGDLGTTMENIPSAKISDDDRKYPIGDTETPRGFVVLGRRMDGSRNDYQLIIVAYTKDDPGNDVQVVNINCNVAGTSVTGATGLRIGSPLINVQDGQYATLIEVDEAGTTGTLDHELDADGAISAFVIAESDVTDLSPAISVLVARTALKQ